MQNRIGLFGSALLVLFSGFYLAFNVYAVDLKSTFNFNQTQVELISSFAIGGGIMTIVGSVIFNKYGSRTSFATSWFLVTTSSILMWLSTSNENFFTPWTTCVLTCLLLFINSGGLSMIAACCICIALLQFPDRHNGKIIGLYYAFGALGKIYYGVLYHVFFEMQHNLEGLFLTVAVSVTVAVAFCVIFHSYETSVSEEMRLLPSGHREAHVPCSALNFNDSSAHTENTILAPTSWTMKDIILSPRVHLLAWPSILQLACGYAVLSNITSIANSLDMEHGEVTVFVMSVGIMISRVTFGFAFDHFRTPLSGLIISLFANVSSGLAMVVAILRPNYFAIYLISVVVSIGSGGLISLTLSILTSICGSQNYYFLMGMYYVAFSGMALTAQIFTGKTFDFTLENTDSDRHSCKQCFHWSFLLWLTVSVICGVVNTFSIYFFRKRAV